jgi:hypothetical protein
MSAVPIRKSLGVNGRVPLDIVLPAAVNLRFS